MCYETCVPLDAQPLGSFDRLASPVLGVALGIGAAFAATSLMELSRTLAERYRGRWFAGNGRDLFHVAAAFVLALAFRASGLPSSMAFLVAATTALFPLLLIDTLPSRRRDRVAVLLALFLLGSAPTVLEPRSITDALNALTAALFRT